MREFKIFIIVAFIIGVMYYGVEPLAHSAMHPEAAKSDYEFKDLEKFGKIDLSMGDAEAGKEAFIGYCASCHTLNSQADADFHSRNPKAIQPVGDNGGVIPPDLSNVGLILDSNYLAHFIKDPVRASLLDAKFMVSCEGLDGEQAALCEQRNEGKEAYPMTAFNGVMSDEEIANVVAYLKSIAPKSISNKEVFLEACNRCHGADYDRGQYDSKFYADTNKRIHSMLEKLSKDGEEQFKASLSDNDHEFLNSLLAIVKAEEKAKLTETELDEHNDEITNRTLDDYGMGVLLQSALRESSFGQGVKPLTNGEHIKAYLGNYAPDLSMMIRSKGHHELAAFINNPQKSPLVDIKKAIINGLVQEKRKADKDELVQKYPDLSEKEKEAKFEEIDLRGAEYYNITLPANTTKSPWQSDDDYTNMAQEMGVMPFGKSMPRIGLTKEAEEQVISYLETIGDSKKEERDSLGLWIIAFFVVLSGFAYLWKNKIWRDLH